jgi:ketosteroid isomerase-like protein
MSRRTAVLLQQWIEAFSLRDSVALASHYTENCVLESPSFGTVSGRNAVQNAFHTWFTSFPATRVEFGDRPVITADRLVHTIITVGTDTGGFLGQPATGRPF